MGIVFKEEIPVIYDVAKKAIRRISKAKQHELMIESNSDDEQISRSSFP
jgi:hypothetical protein